MHQFVKQMTPSVDHRVGTCLKVQTRITEKEGNKTNCVSLRVPILTTLPISGKESHSALTLQFLPAN